MPAPSWLGEAISAGSGLLLTAFSANQTKQLAKGEANLVNAQNATSLAIAKEQTAQAQLAYQAAIASKSGSSDNTMLYIILGVTGVAVLGGVIFIATRKS